MTLVPVNVDKDVYFRKNIEQRVAMSKSLSDDESRIYQKNWYFGYYKKKTVWPVTNFTDYPGMPECKANPVMQTLRTLDFILDKYKSNIPFSDNNRFIRKQIDDTSISLSELATKIGNRDMKEDTYISLLKDKHPSLRKAYDLIDQLQDGFPNIRVRPKK